MEARSVIVPLFQDGELAAVPSPLVQQAYDLWNEYAKANKWQVAMVLDSGRRAALKRAVRDYGGINGFRANLEKIQRSDWCMGRIAPKDGYKQFQASLDWFVRPVTVRKVIENFYNGAEPVTAPRQTPAQAINWRAVLEGYVGKGRSFWHHSLGAPPEDPGPHLAPEEMIADWRRKHGMMPAQGQNGPQTETREERLSASIVSYRKIGQYDRANKLEEDLARLQNRPPVLVPAPDAPNPDLSPRPRPQTARTPPAGKYGHPGGTVTDVPEAPPWDGDVPEGDPAMAEADD